MLGLAVGLVGFFMVGALGAVVGFLAGVAARYRTGVVLMAAAVALLVTAALTIFERPLSGNDIYGFPD
jgi:hypothetical protein